MQLVVRGSRRAAILLREVVAGRHLKVVVPAVAAAGAVGANCGQGHQSSTAAVAGVAGTYATSDAAPVAASCRGQKHPVSLPTNAREMDLC